MEEVVVVTRHKGFVAYLREIGAITDDVEIIPHVNDASQIRGKRVIGRLPYHLGQHAKSVTMVTLDIPKELRGRELSLDQIRKIAGPLETYIVVRQTTST